MTSKPAWALAQDSHIRAALAREAGECPVHEVPLDDEGDCLGCQAEAECPSCQPGEDGRPGGCHGHCPICGDPIDYCLGHGELPEPEASEPEAPEARPQPGAITIYGAWADQDPFVGWQAATLYALASPEAWEAAWDEWHPMALALLPVGLGREKAPAGVVALCHIEEAWGDRGARLRVVAWAGMSDHYADARLWLREAFSDALARDAWAPVTVTLAPLAPAAGRTGTLGDYR